MVTDPIADFLSHIRNGYLAGKSSVAVSYSTMKEQMARIFKEKGYIKNAHVKTQASQNKKGEVKVLEIELQYTNNKPAIEAIRRISSPGRKVYVDSRHIPTVLTGYGIAILSTSMGLMTNKEARKKGIGGEVICYIQ